MPEFTPQTCNFPHFILVAFWCNEYDVSEQQSMPHKQLCTQNQLMITLNNYYRYLVFLNI